MRPARALLLALALPLNALSAQQEIVCTSVLLKKHAVETLTRRHALLSGTCKRNQAQGSPAGEDFCNWAQEALDDKNRCVSAPIPWSSRTVIRPRGGGLQNGAAEVRNFECFTYPEPFSMDPNAVISVTPTKIIVTSEKEKQLRRKFNQAYEPFSIDRKSMKGGPGTSDEYKCELRNSDKR